MNHKVRIPLEIEIFPYMRDHCIEGRAVYPAAEALQCLAASAKAHRPDINVRLLHRAAFPRFLPLPPDESPLDAFNEISISPTGEVTASLLTLSPSKTGAFRRVKEHVYISFGQDDDIGTPTIARPDVTEADGLLIPVRRLYRDLVPFGTAYHNLQDPIRLWEQGALAHITAPDVPGPAGPLGSAFPFDAAMHLACAWGQRFAGFVGFPTGFHQRIIVDPAVPKATYIASVMPVTYDKREALFNIWIYDLKDHLHEVIQGVRMKDITAGRIKPPPWIMAGGK